MSMTIKTGMLMVAAGLAAGGCCKCSERPPHVIGKIAEAQKYVGLHPRFAKAFEFLQRKDLATLPVGRYEIDGDNCWAMIQEPELHPIAGAKTEAHRKYIDIQAPISAPEVMGLFTMDAPELALPFDVEKDYVLFDKSNLRQVTLQPGEFAIFFPPLGAHAPCCAPDNKPMKIKKLVIKIRAD